MLKSQFKKDCHLNIHFQANFPIIGTCSNNVLGMFTNNAGAGYTTQFPETSYFFFSFIFPFEIKDNCHTFKKKDTHHLFSNQHF